MNRLIQIEIACADADEAHRIASALVSERLAACVQLTPITSIYRWDGQIETSPEIRLSVKTVTQQLEAIEARVKAMHSYDVPQITATEIVNASAEYVDWVRDETSG
ncbi:MAG: divalent-cation tolerance protein CutA [Pseudomonadota bacterium]